MIEDLFEANGWADTWRDGIYDYVHYHSRIHEALGVARGKGRVRFGRKNGRIFALKAGDVGSGRLSIAIRTAVSQANWSSGPCENAGLRGLAF